MILTVGQSLASTTDTTTVVVIRAPGGDVALTCGGAEMVAAKQGSPIAMAEAAAGLRNGTQLGKRYEDKDGTLELLCTKSGTSSLAIGAVEMVLKTAKPLPASD